MIPIIEQYWTEFLEILKILIIVIVALVIDRMFSRYIKSIAKMVHVDVETLKGVRVFFRIILLTAVIIALASVKWLPTEYFVGAGALIGAAIGFASTNAISNFIIGMYVIITGKVRIGDYIKIGNHEGVIADMTINNVKIVKDDGSHVLISNTDVLNKEIIKFKVEENGHEYYAYPIDIPVSVSVPIEEIKNTVMEIKEKIKDRIKDIELIVSKITSKEITYTVIAKIPEAEDIFMVKKEVLRIFAEKITSRAS